MTKRSSVPIPFEKYGVLFQNYHESESDEIPEQVRLFAFCHFNLWRPYRKYICIEDFLH